LLRLHVLDIALVETDAPNLPADRFVRGKNRPSKVAQNPRARDAEIEETILVIRRLMINRDPGESLHASCGGGIWYFARCMRAHPTMSDAQTTDPGLRAIVKILFNALPEAQVHGFDEFWLLFCDAWVRIRLPMNEDPTEIIIARARDRADDALPKPASTYTSAGLIRLTHIVRAYGWFNHGDTFPLSSRMACRCVGLTDDSSSLVSGWLRTLIYDGLLKLVKPGEKYDRAQREGKRKGVAAEYRWLHELEPRWRDAR